MKMFNGYNFKARIIPACICIIPLLVFYYFFLSKELAGLISFASDYFKLVGDITVPFLSIFLLAQFSRSVSKFVYEKRYFRNQTKMPTTNLLLYSDKKYSDDYKNQIHQKIFNDFNIQLLSIDEEEKDKELACKKIIEAVGLIRDKVKNGRLLLQHNIEYGFYRNLIGGSTIAFILSVLGWFFFGFISPNYTAKIVSIVLIVLYFIPVILSKKIITSHGYLYADILFKEYLSL